MMPSKDMSDIKGSISDKPAEAIVDPIFLGFDSSGFPLIFASNTTLTIKN